MSEGPAPSYYASPESNQRALRPGQPPGRTVSQLQTNPTREWVKRNSPAQKFDAEKDNFFFSGTSVIKSVGKDEGLSGVRCMAVVNEKVWVGEREGCFSVWDFHTGDRLFRSTKKRDIFVWSVLGPVNGDLVWIGTSDSFVRVFNSDTMELVKEMKEHVGGVYCMADTPGSRFVFSGSSDFTIVKWDGPRMERLAQFTGHSNNVRALLVVGKRLFSGSDDNTIRVWDIKTGICQQMFEQHTGGVHALAFACGKFLWSASEDKTIRVWNPENGSCVKVIDSPHTGQINCLTLIGSLMWSSSWNIAFVWDPETFEQKGQYKCHEGCINALLPVHQAVVSRVWSASNDGVINLWDTECTYRSAINAASDGRLEEALAQLEEAQNAVELAKKKTLDMEQICVQLNAEKERLNFTHNATKDKHDQVTRDLRRQCQEANQRVFDLKDKLEQAGKVGDSDFDIPEVLAAYQKGMEPGSVMPAEYEDDADLDASERERRAKLREAFLKGKANAPLPGDDRPRSDALEARLKAALERAYRNGDSGGAQRVRSWLDQRFPKWRESAAEPIVPIDYIDESKLSDNERDRKRRLRGEFIEGLVDGDLEKVPTPPEDATDFEREQYRDLRDAYLRGNDAKRIFPQDVHNPGRRAAFSRGLGNKYGPVPEDYVDSDALDKDTRRERSFQRSAFLRGRYANSLIPQEFEDQQGLPTEERERRRKLREHFLHGLTMGPNAELPEEYKDNVSDLEAISQIRRESARNAFQQGQNAPSLIPEEYMEAYSPDSPDVQSLRSELRDAFLQGMGHGEMPNTLTGHSEGFNRQLQDAYKKGWIAGCPFEVQAVGNDDHSPMRRASFADELEKRKEMMELLEKLEKENTNMKAENERLLKEHQQTLDDLNKLREQIASFGIERSVRLDPTTLSANELATVKELLGDPDADPELLSAPHKVKVTGLGEVNLDDLSLEEREKILSVVAKHRDEEDRENFRKEHGLISIGGRLVAEFPAVDELTREENAKVMDINEKYDYQGGPDGAVNLPAWEDMDEEEVSFLKDLMGKHRVMNHSSPTRSDYMPVTNANTILSDAVATVMNEDMPDEVRRELANVLSNDTEQSTDAIREAVNDSSLPEEIKQKLFDACDQVDEENRRTLENAMRRASRDNSLPADVRKQFEDILDSKDDQDGYIDRLQDAVRRASTVGNVADDTKKELREAAGEHDKQVANLYKQVLNVIHDSALSREQRLALNERIAPPSRPHHVPEAVRELLASEASFPADTRAEFVRVLEGHDNRSNELASAIEDGGFEELKDAINGPRNALPTAVRIKSMSQDTPAEDRKVLLDAFNVHHGRTAATEDAARDALEDLKLPAASRRHLRNAIYRSGVSHEDLLADAVRYAVAHPGTPTDVIDNLNSGLIAVESKQGDLCAVVRRCLKNDDLPEQTVSDLEPALGACESRPAQLSAAIKDICAKEQLSGQQKGVLANAAKGCDRKVSVLEEAVAIVSARGDVPDSVCDELRDALDINNDRGINVWEAIYNNRDVLDADMHHFAGLEREDPVNVCAKIREVLADSEAGLSARRVLHDAIVEADEKAAGLRDSARSASRNLTVPADARRQLKLALGEYDASADKLSAQVRQLLNDGSVKPAARHSLHGAIAESDDKYLTLADTTRSQALSPEVAPEVKIALSDAVVEASGRTKELYREAKIAAHNPEVPADVRKVLREALGEDELSAVDVLRTSGLPEYQRRAINDALVENDATSIELRDAVKDVLDNCDLSDSMVEYLKGALEPVDESNQFLLDIVGSAEGEEGLGDDSRDMAKLANGQNISDVVRHLLQDAGIKDITRVNIADALAEHESKSAQLEDVVRSAIEKGTLPEEAVDKLNAALERKALQRKALETIMSEAKYDPNMPLEARRVLADRQTDDVEHNMKVAKDVLATDLPEDHREDITTSLKACESRLQELLDSCRNVSESHGMDSDAKQALRDCEDVVDVHDVIGANVLPEDAEEEVKKALAKYYGREADLARALDDAAKDVAVSPASKSRLRQGSFEGEGIANVEKALQHHDLSDEVRTVLEDALNEAQQEGPSVVQQGKDHQMARLTVELEETLQGLKDELRREKNSNENMSDENETLKLTVREYEQLIDNLGGFEEASKLAETGNSMQGLDDTIAEKERRLRELSDALERAEARGVGSRRSSANAGYDEDADANRGEGEDESEDAGAGEGEGEDMEGGAEEDPEVEADRIRKQRLRDAFLDGGKATMLTPLPEQYRTQDATDVDDASFRDDLTHEWLKGRQQALGSIVPPEYAGVTGLSDDDAVHRAGMRSAFLNGMQSGDGSHPIDETPEYIEAFKKGKALRDKELYQAGVEEGDEDGQVVRAFNSGINGEGSDEVDASLLASGLPVEDCQNLTRVYNRGKWLRNDILGGEGLDSLEDTNNADRLDQLAGDRSKLAQLLNELDDWHKAADHKTMRGLGYPAPSPAYFRALQAALDEANQKLRDTEGLVREQQDKLRAKEKILEDEHRTNLTQLEKERALEVDKLKGLLHQLESDLTNKGNVHNSLHNRIERLTEQLGKSSAENEILTQELIKKAAIGDVTELVTYYKERERKWNELSQLNRELQVENKTLLTESTALAHKLRALSFVFESRPTLVRSLYELYKLLSHIPQTLVAFAKEAKKRQLPRLEILDEIREVNSEVDTCKDGTRWIIANLFTSYELQHLGTSPQFFIPDGRRLTWRDIQVPTKQRELLLSTWYGDGEEPVATTRSSPQRQKVTTKKR